MNEEPPNGMPDCFLMPFRCHTPEGQDGSLKIGYFTNYLHSRGSYSLSGEADISGGRILTLTAEANQFPPDCFTSVG